MNISEEYMNQQADLLVKNDSVSRELFDEYGVKKGLRDQNGAGVLTGLTNISTVNAFRMVDGVKTPCEGELRYRGYDVKDLVRDAAGKRFIYEEAAYLLLFGELPTAEKLEAFRANLAELTQLPTNFTRDVIMKAPSEDIMNSMTRSILTLASYDSRKEDLSLSNVLRQSMMLITVFPMLAVYGYHAHNHYDSENSMYIHRPDTSLTTAENFLRLLRPDMKFTDLEARVLDMALMLHMEHGGGNNSTFTTRVVTSAGTDTYSAIAAAMSSLKGHKHGGANLQVVRMMDDIIAHVSDYEDQDEIAAYLRKIVRKEAYDGKGLIYGMGHAIYSLSDPREQILRTFAAQLARAKGLDRELALYTNIEQAAPKVIAEERKIYKGVCPNVDFYSGFVYEMLGIPRELFTPLFAIARITGWSAHRLEELVTMDKIIRPAYRSVAEDRGYIPMEER